MRQVVWIGAVVLLMQLVVFPVGAQGQQASAELRDSSGNVVGSATFVDSGGGVQVSVQARNLPPGQHGIHVHAVGRCDPPDFMTAGAHANPTNRQHGLRNPQGPHGGDLPNLTIAQNGSGSLQATNNLLTVGAGPNSLFDDDGSALVIHAMADDDVTDPTGNSGGRIACGVVARGPGTLPSTGLADAGGVPALALLALALLASGAALRRYQSA